VHQKGKDCVKPAIPVENDKIWGIVSELRNPKPIGTKFVITDYVGDMTQHAKIQTDRPSGAYRQMGEISLSRGF